MLCMSIFWDTVVLNWNLIWVYFSTCNLWTEHMHHLQSQIYQKITFLQHLFSHNIPFYRIKCVGLFLHSSMLNVSIVNVYLRICITPCFMLCVNGDSFRVSHTVTQVDCRLNHLQSSSWECVWQVGEIQGKNRGGSYHGVHRCTTVQLYTLWPCCYLNLVVIIMG